MAKVSR